MEAEQGDGPLLPSKPMTTSQRVFKEASEQQKSRSRRGMEEPSHDKVVTEVAEILQVLVWLLLLLSHPSSSSS